MTVRKAHPADAPALTSLINRAFLVERAFIDGDRLNLAEVELRLTTGVFLLAVEHGSLKGCVYLEKQDNHAYLGLLSVEPEHQGRGTARLLMSAAEEQARELGCCAIDLRIVSLREELPPFYRRFGYQVSGSAALPDNIPVQLPCHFIVMSKQLA